MRRLPWVQYYAIGDGDAEACGQEMLDLLCEIQQAWTDEAGTEAERMGHLPQVMERLAAFLVTLAPWIRPDEDGTKC